MHIDAIVVMYLFMGHGRTRGRRLTLRTLTVRQISAIDSIIYIGLNAVFSYRKLLPDLLAPRLIVLVLLHYYYQHVAFPLHRPFSTSNMRRSGVDV